jgi:alpha-L-fucosidase 2
MKANQLNWIMFALVAAGSAVEITAEPIGDSPLVLWYDKPAVKWVEALPVGNGRLGAMIFGGVNQERLQFNEGTLWAGGPYDPVNPEAKEALPQVRQLVNEGKYREAAALISAKVMAKPLGQMPYQTVGDLLLTFPGLTNIGSYRRDLNLDTAMATVSYTTDGVRYTREVFASAPDNVIVVHLAADKPGKISFVAGMKTRMAASVETVWMKISVSNSLLPAPGSRRTRLAAQVSCRNGSRTGT